MERSMANMEREALAERLGASMRLHGFVGAAVIASCAIAFSPAPRALGKPGINPVPCPQQQWQFGDAAFEALPGAKAFFGRYDGGLYRIEIPETWNGELVLYAHGYVPNQGQNGSNLRVGNHTIREHLIKEGFAWAASSYRCNGYVPGQGLVDTMALVDLFTKSNGGRAPHVSDRHVDGRPRHDPRPARISNVVCGRTGDVSRRTGAL
jgi:hypothetical protein